MPIISHMGIDYDSPNIQIQDNASATDLDNTKVPTGQTIESFFLNNKNNTALTYQLASGWSLASWGSVDCRRVGPFVIINIYGLLKSTDGSGDVTALTITSSGFSSMTGKTTFGAIDTTYGPRCGTASTKSLQISNPQAGVRYGGQIVCVITS